MSQWEDNREIREMLNKLPAHSHMITSRFDFKFEFNDCPNIGVDNL